MTIWVGQGGVWRRMTGDGGSSVGVDGSYRSIEGVWVGAAGEWQRAYSPDLEVSIEIGNLGSFNLAGYSNGSVSGFFNPGGDATPNEFCDRLLRVVAFSGDSFVVAIDGAPPPVFLSEVVYEDRNNIPRTLQASAASFSSSESSSRWTWSSQSLPWDGSIVGSFRTVTFKQQ